MADQLGERLKRVQEIGGSLAVGFEAMFGLVQSGKLAPAVFAEAVDQILELGKQAITDSLTGLFNRRFYEAEIEQEVAQVDRHGQSLSLIVFDIDNFKLVNDKHGHVEGDRVLRELGMLIRGHVRQGDTACRCGGEEFVIILPQTRLRDEQGEENGAHEMAERLRSLVEKNLNVWGKPLTISLGVAQWQKGNSSTDLFRRADQALISAKNEGRNVVKVAD